MKKLRENLIMKTVNTPPKQEDCIWSGQPNFIAFLFVHEKFLWEIIFIAGYFGFCAYFEIDMYSNYFWLLAIMFIGYMLSSVFTCSTTMFYITRESIIIKKGVTFYTFEIQNIELSEVKCSRTMIETYLQCGTICFADIAQNSGPRKSRFDRTTFYCISEYEKVRQFILNHK